MTPANFGAVRRLLYGAAVLALFAAPASSQVVEKGRTFADLTSTHACSAAYTDRIARVTDCDAADDVGDGGGAFQCWVQCDGSAPWETVAIGGGGGGLPGADEVTESMLKATNAATDEYVLTYESTVGDFEWQAAATGTIGGTLGTTDNGICRADGVGGVTAQGSPLTLSDVSGVTTTLATITPAATTGATVAGQSMAFTASPAVASTDTAGAAAGGSVTISTGAAARNSSGNADGGSFTFDLGAGIGTGVRGQALFPLNGTAARPTISFAGETDTGIYAEADYLHFSAGGTRRMFIAGGATSELVVSTSRLSGGITRISGFTAFVEANTAGSGSPNVLSETETLKTLTNEGATAEQYNTLPGASSSGYIYEACVQDSDGLRLTAAAGDTIRSVASVTTAGGYITSSTIGSCVELKSINATEWMVTSITGAWSFN